MKKSNVIQLYSLSKANENCNSVKSGELTGHLLRLGGVNAITKLFQSNIDYSTAFLVHYLRVIVDANLLGEYSVII